MLRDVSYGSSTIKKIGAFPGNCVLDCDLVIDVRRGGAYDFRIRSRENELYFITRIKTLDV